MEKYFDTVKIYKIISLFIKSKFIKTNKQNGVFIGLVPLMERYLDTVEIGVRARCSMKEYIKLISNRASG